MVGCDFWWDALCFKAKHVIGKNGNPKLKTFVIHNPRFGLTVCVLYNCMDILGIRVLVPADIRGKTLMSNTVPPYFKKIFK